MNKVRCIVCDIDYTLAVKGGMLMPLTKKSLTVAHERGIKIGLASGREIDRKLINQDVIWDLDFKFDFIIGMNGGQVRDIENNNYYSVDLMDIDYMKKIISSVNDIVMDNKIAVNVEGGDNMYAMNINEELIAVQKRKGVVYLDASDNIDLLCSKPAYKFLFRSTKENCELIRKMVKKFYPEELQCIETFPGTIEVFKSGYDKGTGLKMYADWNSIDMEDIVAFGDNENDIPMLKAAGTGVAVSNATDVTKKAADKVSEYSCFEDGVGHYLLDHIL